MLYEAINTQKMKIDDFRIAKALLDDIEQKEALLHDLRKVQNADNGPTLLRSLCDILKKKISDTTWKAAFQLMIDEVETQINDYENEFQRL